MERGSGLLVHISELPSKYGIGNFGSEARKFVRFLSGANQQNLMENHSKIGH